MVEKTSKKPAAKKASEKKTVSKPATTGKVASKKIAVTPVPSEHKCGCEHGCSCGDKCHCAKKKCTFGRFLKKLILFMIIFALGFAAAKMYCCNKHGDMIPMHPEFENGCLVIKCPKMEQKLAKLDTDNDGCISRAEYRGVKKHAKHHKREKQHVQPEQVQPEQQAQPAPAAEDASNAPAPQVAE